LAPPAPFKIFVSTIAGSGIKGSRTRYTGEWWVLEGQSNGPQLEKIEHYSEKCCDEKI
jgi:hypothetical protein